MAKLCRFCGSKNFLTLEGPFGPHFAKLVCAECRRMDKFLPRPEGPRTAPPRAVLDRVRPRAKACVLRGTPNQVRFASSLRQTLMHQARESESRALLDLIMCVSDATWFIAQKGRTAGDIRWPSADQVEDPTPTGTCSNCGEDAYEHLTCCSQECSDEYAAWCATATPIDPPDAEAPAHA